jgi:hypothetical protein
MPDYCKVPEGCPAVNVNIFTLKDTLRDLILNVNKRIGIAQLGRAYVERENDHVKICAKLLEWLEIRDDLPYDFAPTFYKKLEVPKSILADEKRYGHRKRFEFYRMLINGVLKKKSDN